MTDHGIEELKRQHVAAESRRAKAASEEREARAQLNAAMCAAKIAEFEAMGGVIGKTRVRVVYSGAVIMGHGPYVVANVHVPYSSAEFVLSKINKDGTASKAHSSRSYKIVAILPGDQS